MKTTAIQENLNACKAKDKNVWTKTFPCTFYIFLRKIIISLF